jgi:outer membrane receptor protein involved in Fe transport
LLSAAPAWAQNAQSDPIVSETIIVTAQQREQRLIDVPISVNALDAEEIADRRINNLQDLSFAVPEMINVVTGMAQNRVMLRGVGEGGGNFPLVSIYLDDVAASGPLRGPLDIRPLDVERVEVLNGPQGTLYGQESVGGVVRFLTANPVIGQNSLAASADVWGTSDGSLSERVTGVTNLALGDQAALRIAGTYEDVGGWIDAPTAGRSDVNDGQMYQVRVKGLFNVTDNLQLVPMVQIHRNDVGAINNGENANGDLILPAFAPNAVQSAQNDHELYSLTAHWDLGDVNLLAVGSVWRNVSTGGYYSPFAGNGRLFRFDNRDEAQSGELRITSDDDGRWQWAAGAFYRNADFNSVTTLYQTGPANGTTSTNVNFVIRAPIKSESWSFYANSSFDLTERLQVGGGLRYFTDDEVAPTPGQAGQSFESVDPRIFVSYELEENWNIYATAAKGFRSGGFNAVNPAFPQSYEPEDVWSYEVGSKFQTTDGLFSGEIALFYSRYDNMQATTIATSIGQGYTGNIGRADIQGVDWSFRVRPNDWLAFGATGVLLDTDVVSVAPSSAYIAGDRLNYIPEYNVALFAEAEADISDAVTARFRVDYNQRGSSVFAQRTVNLTATGDTLNFLNASLALNWGQYGVEFYSDNILDDRGAIFPNPVAFETRAVPRTIGLRSTVSF